MAANIKYLNNPSDSYRLELVFDGQHYCGQLTNGFEIRPITLWSGKSGLLGTNPLKFANVASFEVVYGTAIVGTFGGRGGYETLHDPANRKPIAKITDVGLDGSVTAVYVEMERARAVVGLGWIKDFQ